MSKAEELLNIANKTNLSEDFIKAGNHFIIEDEYALAAVSLQKAGEIYMINSNKYTAANAFVRAADNYVKDKQYKVAQVLLDKAINIYLGEGKFATAAKQFLNLGEIYYQDKEIALAIESYEKSCKWFCNEDSKSTGYGILYKAAELAIDNKEYTKAISLLIQVNDYYESNKLTEFKCKQLLLEISILKLYTNDDCASYFLTREKHKSTREYELISQLMQSLVEHNKEQFNEAMGDFNSIQPLEGWKLKLLFEIEERV
jgi:alpha-soluble NSF attachment protein